MAKLITNHDPFHIHKILGVCALLNYIYRFFLLLTIGTCFPQDEPKSISVTSVLLHALLSLSSLLLPLPKKRNFSSPMIWPEFRLHSITFASRHAIMTIAVLCNAVPENIWANLAFRLLIITGTIQIASIITDKYGCRVKRTTNAMAYPKHITEEMQKPVKKFYTLSQFGATATCLLDDPTILFVPIFAIQIAPLMMTFVRKGKASAASLHRVYALSLYFAFVAAFIRYFVMGKDFTFKYIFVLSMPASKLRRIFPSKVVWLIVSFVATIIYPTMVAPLVQDYVSEEFYYKLLVACVSINLPIRLWNISVLYLPKDLSMSLTFQQVSRGMDQKKIE